MTPLSEYIICCPQCGGKVFHAIPGTTTSSEITAFKTELCRRRGIAVEEPDWIHPGSFCYDCNWGVLVEYAQLGVGRVAEDQRDAVLVLDSVGSDIKAVAAVLKRGLEITSTEALRITRVGCGVLARRPSARDWQLMNLEAAIRSAGGTAHLERVEQENASVD